MTSIQYLQFANPALDWIYECIFITGVATGWTYEAREGIAILTKRPSFAIVY
ncbi:MAG TPA: hypothetical protein V6D11_10155 [Waterburya sp.]